MIVIRSDAAKKCYAYDMQYNKAASNETKAGVLQVGKIWIGRYRVPVIQKQHNYIYYNYLHNVVD